MENIFIVRNEWLHKDDNFILVANYFSGNKNEIWNCPFSGKIEDFKNSSDIGVWKIKQLKK
jgi:hypothetical protein